MAVVHAFSDGPYNRSSFHLAGCSTLVSFVASRIALKAVYGLQSCDANVNDPTVDTNNNHNGNSSSSHPYAGLVDHVSVMPLMGHDEATITSETRSESNDVSAPSSSSDGPNEFSPTTASGKAARSIGRCLSNAGVNVFYYGSAHEETAPLAQVRRESTNFFDTTGSTDRSVGTATVGAPLSFVENYNVRLTDKCNRKTARDLTKHLRERDGGLAGVEALTLPYSNGRYEAACNLLQPNVGSAEAIEERAHEWARTKLDSLSLNSVDELVGTMYRVGTTCRMCQQVMDLCDDRDGNNTESTERMKQHDKAVFQQLQEYLSV